MQRQAMRELPYKNCLFSYRENSRNVKMRLYISNKPVPSLDGFHTPKLGFLINVYVPPLDSNFLL